MVASTGSNELSTNLESGQNDKDGFSVFSGKEQNGIMWIDGRSASLKSSSMSNKELIVDIYGTKLHPEDTRVFKFTDKDIYPEEIKDFSKSQTTVEQTELSNLVTFGSDEANNQALTKDDTIIINGNEELSLQQHSNSSVGADDIDQEHLIESDVFAMLKEDSTEASLFDQLITGTDLFGADLASIPIDDDSLWRSPLGENVFFDTALVYSSHEFISLNGGKRLYDDSPSDSLIFVNESVRPDHI